MIIENIKQFIDEMEEFYFNTIEGQIILIGLLISYLIITVVGIIQTYKRIYKK